MNELSYIKNIDSLKEELLKFNGMFKYNSSGTHISTFCPKCETHKFFDKSKNHGHLYISLEDPVFICFRCHSFKGFITSFVEFVKINFGLNLYSYFDIINLSSNMEDIISKKVDTYNESIDKNKNKKITTHIINDDLTNFKDKLDYLTKRTGLKDFEIIKDSNVVFDIDRFIKRNNIVLMKKTFDVLPMLQENYIGFLTKNKSKLVCRCINQTDEKTTFRYHNLYITNNNLIKDYYLFKENKERNFSYNNALFVLSEGIFSLLNGIKEKEKLSLFFDFSRVWAFVAGLGLHYSNLIKSLCFDYKVSKCDIIILSDPIEKNSNLNYNWLKYNPFVSKYDILFNNNFDFGEPITNISKIRGVNK